MPVAARKSVSRTIPRLVGCVEEVPLIVEVSHQGDGCTYGLHPLTSIRMKASHPKKHVVPFVFIGYRGQDEFEKLQRPMWPQIAQALLGLSLAKLKALGGVELMDRQSGWRRRIV